MYECHITTDWFDRGEGLGQVLVMKAAVLGFKFANLKKVDDSWSQEDSFCSSKATDIDELDTFGRRMKGIIQDAGIKVRRYKIEKIIIDERYG